MYFSACSNGPDVFFCWKETAWLAKAAEYGYFARTESFEDEAVFGPIQYPNSIPVVTNMSVGWSTNHPDMPVGNGVSVGNGAARTGQWGMFDPMHGYPEGSPGICDVDNPPEPCLYHDGFTGEVSPGLPPLVGVGGYFQSTYGGSIDIIIDDTNFYPGGFVFNYHFLVSLTGALRGSDVFPLKSKMGKLARPSTSLVMISPS